MNTLQDATFISTCWTFKQAYLLLLESVDDIDHELLLNVIRWIRKAGL